MREVNFVLRTGKGKSDCFEPQMSFVATDGGDNWERPAVNSRLANDETTFDLVDKVI